MGAELAEINCDQAASRRRPQRRAAQKARAALEVEYWTDPLCCWSWAMEPQWRRLRYEFDGSLSIRYRMGGMIRDWSSYSDPLNSVSRPFQMGPLWFQARHTSGMPIDERIWIDDPPESSYLACMAVKAAQRQGERIGEMYLRKVREAVMLHRRNVARRDVLIEIGKELARTAAANFDVTTFARDLECRAAARAFREDLKQGAYQEIGRFPTLTFRRAGERDGMMLVGYRPYRAIRQAMARVFPDLRPTHAPIVTGNYASFWGELLTREMEEIAVARTEAPAV